jgi:hypothetical protein
MVGVEMGGILDEHVEWAVVKRLKAMLDEPPKTKFNVTQSFALFTSVLLWAKNRAWVAGLECEPILFDDPADRSAHDARRGLRHQLICGEPWRLSRKRPIFPASVSSPEEDINSDFEGMTAEVFFEWLRNALAHGDGRNIRPIHKLSRRGNRTLLAGFRIEGRSPRRSPPRLVLSLYNADMRRMGALLADQFCRSMSGDGQYALQEIATSRVDEAA